MAMAQNHRQNRAQSAALEIPRPRPGTTVRRNRHRRCVAHAVQPARVVRPFVAVLAASALAACYDPTFAECTVRCADNAECAPSQVCGAAGWCAAPGTVGACAVDAGAGADAAFFADGSVALFDAGGSVADGGGSTSSWLTIIVFGKGRVAGGGAIECETSNPNLPSECRYAVTSGQVVTLVASAVHHHWRFAGWSAACAAATEPSCTLDLAGNALVVVRFAESD